MACIYHRHEYLNLQWMCVLQHNLKNIFSLAQRHQTGRQIPTDLPIFSLPVQICIQHCRTWGSAFGSTVLCCWLPNTKINTRLTSLWVDNNALYAKSPLLGYFMFLHISSWDMTQLKVPVLASVFSAAYTRITVSTKTDRTRRLVETPFPEPSNSLPQ